MSLAVRSRAQVSVAQGVPTSTWLDLQLAKLALVEHRALESGHRYRVQAVVGRLQELEV